MKVHSNDVPASREGFTARMVALMLAGLVFAVLSVFAQPAQASRWLDESLDPWNTKDKRDHATAGAILGLGAPLLLPTSSGWTQFGACMVPGLLWEGRQAAIGGFASWRDIVVHGIGCGGGVPLGRSLKGWLAPGESPGSIKVGVSIPLGG